MWEDPRTCLPVSHPRQGRRPCWAPSLLQGRLNPPPQEHALSPVHVASLYCPELEDSSKQNGPAVSLPPVTALPADACTCLLSPTRLPRPAPACREAAVLTSGRASFLTFKKKGVVVQSLSRVRPRGLQHAGLPCPPPSPGVCSSSRWLRQNR